MKSQRVHPTGSPRLRRARWVRIFAGIAVAALATVDCEGVQYPNYPPAIVRAPDVNKQNDINNQQGKKQSFETANIERKKQIADESAKLLKLASELKVEVDKTDKDTLSIGVIRKANEIEKLARSVKEKMQLTVGAS